MEKAAVTDTIRTETKTGAGKYAVTVLAVIAVLALCAASLLGGEIALSDVQRGTLRILAIVCGCSVLYCFIVGEIVQNFSQMDKLWSLLPIVYTWIITVRGGFRPRLIAAALVVTAWGIRLTVNFARKGAYRLKFWTGNEDYRWSIVRANPVFRHRIAWVLFDLFFISFYQNALVLAICLPALAAMESDAPLGWIDFAAVAFAVFFLILETAADELQWRFHEEKKRLLADGKSLSELPMPYRLGFNTFGIWAWMRHPNYLGEQGIWLSLYFLAVGAGVAYHDLFHWSAAGPLLLVLLFIGSSALGESISAKKYPAYAAYIRQVWKYLPVRRFHPETDGER